VAFEVPRAVVSFQFNSPGGRNRSSGVTDNISVPFIMNTVAKSPACPHIRGRPDPDVQDQDWHAVSDVHKPFPTSQIQRINDLTMQNSGDVVELDVGSQGHINV
jgi:hypothetical protein